MQLMDGGEQLVEAVTWLEQNLTFDLDERVHVFELTIRALGEHFILQEPTVQLCMWVFDVIV